MQEKVKEFVKSHRDVFEELHQSSVKEGIEKGFLICETEEGNLYAGGHCIGEEDCAELMDCMTGRATGFFHTHHFEDSYPTIGDIEYLCGYGFDFICISGTTDEKVSCYTVNCNVDEIKDRINERNILNKEIREFNEKAERLKELTEEEKEKLLEKEKELSKRIEELQRKGHKEAQENSYERFFKIGIKPYPKMEVKARPIYRPKIISPENDIEIMRRRFKDRMEKLEQ